MQVFAYEPDPLEREVLKVMLDHEGYRAEVFQAEISVLKRLGQAPSATAIVSMHDPERGTALCRQVRELSAAPLVALTPRLDEDLATLLYEIGVDEVVARPIRPRMFVARLENLHRRTGNPVARQEAEEKVVIGPFTLLPTRLELRKNDQVIHLTPLQCRILYHLMANAGHIVPKSRLEDKVWGCDGEYLSSAVKTHICHLRQKVEDDPLSPRFIQTVKGVGYMFQPATV